MKKIEIAIIAWETVSIILFDFLDIQGFYSIVISRRVVPNRSISVRVSTTTISRRNKRRGNRSIPNFFSKFPQLSTDVSSSARVIHSKPKINILPNIGGRWTNRLLSPLEAIVEKFPLMINQSFTSLESWLYYWMLKNDSIFDINPRYSCKINSTICKWILRQPLFQIPKS